MKRWTTREASEILKVPAWRVSELYRKKRLPETARHGGFRMLGADDLAAISEVLDKMGVQHVRPEQPLPESA